MADSIHGASVSTATRSISDIFANAHSALPALQEEVDKQRKQYFLDDDEIVVTSSQRDNKIAVISFSSPGGVEYNIPIDVTKTTWRRRVRVCMREIRLYGMG